MILICIANISFHDSSKESYSPVGFEPSQGLKSVRFKISNCNMHNSLSIPA